MITRVPGETVRVTPSGINISLSRETSPDHVVSDFMTVLKAAEGRKRKIRKIKIALYLFIRNIYLRRKRKWGQVLIFSN
jgi:hypothetical protein